MCGGCGDLGSGRPYTHNNTPANTLTLCVTILSSCMHAASHPQPAHHIYNPHRRLQVFYRATTREVRRVESLARSPLYQTFKEASDGGPVLRAHSQQARFALLNELQVSRTLRAGASSLAASLWLGLRLELLACSVVGAIGCLAVAAARGWGPSVSPGLLGLVLAYALPITSMLNGVLTSSAETEQDMVAVERVVEYMTVTPQVLFP